MNSITSSLTSGPLTRDAVLSRDQGAWPRRVLVLAAAWNILGGMSALLDPLKHASQMYHSAFDLHAPTMLFFFRCTWINVIAWGVGYLVAAFAPSSRHSILAAGGIGKLAYFLACVCLFLSGAGKPMILIAGIFDLLFVVGFIWILMRHSSIKSAVRHAAR